MHLSQLAFWFFVLSIVGAGCVATGIPFYYIVCATILAGIVFIFLGVFTNYRAWFWRGFFCLFILCGSGYALWYQSNHTPSPPQVLFGVQSTYSGEIVSYPRAFDASQSFLLKTTENDVISVRVPPVYAVQYADTLRITGIVESLSSTTQYLKQEGVVGTLSFGRVESITRSTSFSFLRTLYSVRDRVGGIFRNVFSRDQGALASGLLLGQQSASFSSSLKNDMKQSGTTHLVALSGYNISIVIQVLYGIVGFWISRKKSFLFMMMGVILFVLMTGAEASVVRAAIMGSLLLVAERLSRVYNFAHAMAATAWVMILFNPLSFVFNIGFILSFISLWGMSYIGPILLYWLQSISWISFVWARAFSETVGAQIAVAPLLLYWFGGVSLSGVITNIILLPLVPVAMGLSFCVALGGFLFLPFGWLLSFVVRPILSFFLWIIHLGAQFGFVTHQVSLGVVMGAYLVLIGIMIKYKKLRNKEVLYTMN
ncbi:MAG: ComEC/Rec2 family competence protein [Candidatus Paceibacterota bacterium]